MSPPPDIPGFYYDPDKRKYFRLLPSHAAPTASFYTASAVQHQQREKQRVDEQRRERARQLARRRRSPLSGSPYAKIGLLRELGAERSREDAAEDARRVYARGLRHHRVVELEPRSKITAFATAHGSGDEEETMIVIGTSVGPAGDVRTVLARRNEHGVMESDACTLHTLHRSWSQVTSISISSRRLLMATFMGDQNHPSVYYSRLPEPIASEDLPATGVVAILNGTRSIWTSCASPHPAGDLLLGTSSSVVHMTGHPYDTPQRHFRTTSDVFACSFLPKEPSAFLCGARDGAMRLFDLRVKSSSATTHAVRPEIVVRHNGPITHIRALSEVNVIVNGLKGCAMYDLRFPHPASPSASFAMPTKAAMVYPQVARDDACQLDLGFDVNRERGVMAVAKQDQYVGLYSVRTGEGLPWDAVRSKWANPCKALKFDGGQAPESLWAVDGGALDWYAW